MITGRSATSMPPRSSAAIRGSSIPAICRAAACARPDRRARCASPSMTAASLTSRRCISTARAGRISRSTYPSAATEADALAQVREALAASHAQGEGRPLAVRVTLTGASPLHNHLIARREALQDELRACGFQFASDCWVEQLKIRTSPPARPALEAADALDVEALLAEAAADPDFAACLAELIESVKAKLPADLHEALTESDAVRRLAQDAPCAARRRAVVRIEQLTLERYGAFTDRTLRVSRRGGAACRARRQRGRQDLGAVGDRRFPVRLRRRAPTTTSATTARRCGSAASLRHSDGTLIAARRRKGNKRHAAGRQRPRTVRRSVGAAVGRADAARVSIREFGLTVAGLARRAAHELLKAGGRLAETLAASSAGMTALSRIKDRLQLEADELFTARRSAAKPFYVAIERRDAADRALRDAIVTREAIRQAETAVARGAAASRSAQRRASRRPARRWRAGSARCGSSRRWRGSTASPRNWRRWRTCPR